MLLDRDKIRDEAKREVRDARLERDENVKKTEEFTKGRITDIAQHFEKESEENARRLSKSRADENLELRRQLKDISDLKRQDLIGRAIGRREAIKDFERAQKFKEETIVKNYEAELARKDDQIQNVEKRYAFENYENLAEQEDFYRDVIRRKEQEKFDQKMSLQKAHERARDELKKQNEIEKEKYSERLESQADRLNEARKEALKSQSEAFQTTLKNQRTSLDQQIEQLKKSKEELRNSGDIALISPSAERALRKAINEENEKTIEVQEERMKDLAESIREGYQDRLADTVDESKRNMRLLHQENIRARDSNRSEFIHFIAEIKEDVENKLNEQERQHRKITEAVKRAHTRDLRDLRRQYNDVLNAREIQNETRIREVRKESEFEKRMLQRKLSEDHRIAIRDLEDKMEEQKIQYDTIIEGLKRDMEKSTHEARKYARTELETQQKFYERQIAQLKQQHDERERVLVENFEEELEETRRANARLIRSQS